MAIDKKSIDQRVAELKAQLEEAEKQQEAAERERRARIDKAKKHAGDSRVEAVDSLYEVLGIEPEHPHTRTVKGKVHEVTADKDEKLRTERLVAFVQKLVDEAKPGVVDRLRKEDEAEREERRPKPKAQAPAAASADARQGDEGDAQEAEEQQAA